MSVYLGKVTAKGQITLPKPIRDGLLIQTGDYLEMEIRGRELVVRSAPHRNDALLLRDYSAPYAARTVDLQDLRKRLARLPVSLDEEIRAGREKKP